MAKVKFFGGIIACWALIALLYLIQHANMVILVLIKSRLAKLAFICFWTSILTPSTSSTRFCLFLGQRH